MRDEQTAICSWRTHRECYGFYQNGRPVDAAQWVDSGASTNTELVCNLSEYKAVEDPATAWIWEEHLGSSYGKGPPPKQTFIKTLTGQTIVIPYDAEDTILRMQEKLCDVTGVPPAQQRLVWRGRVLTKAAPVSTTNARSAK